MNTNVTIKVKKVNRPNKATAGTTSTTTSTTTTPATTQTEQTIQSAQTTADKLNGKSYLPDLADLVKQAANKTPIQATKLNDKVAPASPEDKLEGRDKPSFVFPHPSLRPFIKAATVKATKRTTKLNLSAPSLPSPSGKSNITLDYKSLSNQAPKLANCAVTICERTGLAVAFVDQLGIAWAETYAIHPAFLNNGWSNLCAQIRKDNRRFPNELIAACILYKLTSIKQKAISHYSTEQLAMLNAGLAALKKGQLTKLLGMVIDTQYLGRAHQSIEELDLSWSTTTKTTAKLVKFIFDSTEASRAELADNLYTESLDKQIIARLEPEDILTRNIQSISSETALENAKQWLTPLRVSKEQAGYKEWRATLACFADITAQPSKVLRQTKEWMQAKLKNKDNAKNWKSEQARVQCYKLHHLLTAELLLQEQVEQGNPASSEDEDPMDCLA
jgi:hypothetical protein